MAQLLREAERRNVPPEILTAGTPYTIDHLHNGKERIHWDEFVRIMANARQIWSEEEFVAIGERIVASPLLLPLTMAARLLFTPKDFYLYVNKGPGEGGGGLLFTNMQPRCRETGPHQLAIELLTQDGYSLCREFYLMTLGCFIVMPSFLGLPRSSVTMTDVPNGVRYDVTYPAGGGVLRRAFSAISWPFTARAMARELMEANDALEQRYQDLDAARRVLAAQATKLRTAHTVAQLVQQDLDLELSLVSIVGAMVEEAGFAGAEVTLDYEVDGVKVVRSQAHGSGEGASIERRLDASTGRGMGTLRVFCPPSSDLPEREELLDFIVPTIAMAIDNAISYLVVEEYRRGLEVRVQERTAELSEARDALAGTVRDLEAAKEARDRIFANLNHDLRSPLSLIILAISEARSRGVPEASARTLETIEHGARRVLRMVDELLLLAEGREGQVRLNRTLCDLGALTRAVATAWQTAAESAGLTLRYHVEERVRVRADSNALERILANLVSNAVKFTPRGGTIEVSLESVDGQARLEVRDDGPGIDAELKARLFQRFERGSTSKNAIAGSGLGLSLVKQLVEAQDGTVVLLDAPPPPPGPRGALFRVELPLAQASSLVPPPSVTAKLRPSDFGVGDGAMQAAEIYDPPPGVTPRATLLLAEDDPGLREHTARVLAEEYRVLAAPDGVIALELATRHAPDLLITDIAMPNVDGIELTKRFRTLPNNRISPVIVLTTFGGVGDKLSGFEAGAVDYIQKPFEPAELRARVRSQLTIRSLALRLLETEKLAALGTLSAGLAHEIRNPANGIINAIGPLKELLPPEAILPGTPAAQLLDIVEHCSRQVAAMSRQLLGFKRDVEPKRQAVALESLIARVCTTVSPSLEGVELRRELSYKGPIHCAEPLIAQVLTNLVQNGAHAAGRGGWVEVRTGLEQDRIVVEVRDSGPGVPDALKERIFEPFFTTKPAGSGTGLGLSTARDIVLRHGGTLDVRSSAGRTVFRLEIPQPS